MKPWILCGIAGCLIVSESQAGGGVFQKRHVEYAPPQVQLNIGRQHYVPVRRSYYPGYVRCPQTGRLLRRSFVRQGGYYPYYRPRFRVRYY